MTGKVRQGLPKTVHDGQAVGTAPQNPEVSLVSRFQDKVWDFSNENRNPAAGSGISGYIGHSECRAVDHLLTPPIGRFFWRRSNSFMPCAGTLSTNHPFHPQVCETYSAL